MGDWLPQAKRISIAGKPGLTLSSRANPKILFHDMECECWPNWAALGSVPHIDFAPKSREIRQYIPFSKGAYALASPGSPSSPNVDGGVVIQVEVQGYADRGWSRQEAENIAWLWGLISKEAGVPLEYLDKWAKPFGGNETYGTNGPRRISFSEYKKFSGILGHQNVPFNDHWDPGSGGNLVAELTGDDMGTPPKETWGLKITDEDEAARLVLVQSRNQSREGRERAVEARDRANEAKQEAKRAADATDKVLALLVEQQANRRDLWDRVQPVLLGLAVGAAALLGIDWIHN
jgi:hypothetical protein